MNRKNTRKYPGGGTVMRDDYYGASAALAYYKDILNQKLKAKNPKGFTDYFKGMQAVNTDDKKRAKYIQDTPFDDYLTPDEVKTHLGKEYDNYLNAIKTVNYYNVSQGQQPLYGDVEGYKDLNALNYGRRFASLRVTPSLDSTLIDHKTGAEKTYKRRYSYAPDTGITFTEEGDLAAMPNYIKPREKTPTGTAKMAMGGEAEDGLGGYGGLVNQLPGLLNTIIDVAEGTPNYSKQPVLNASTMKGMVSPYNFATGGDVGGLDEDTLQQLQMMADEQGITLEELIMQIQSQQGGQMQEGDDMDMQDYSDMEDEDIEPVTDDEESEGEYRMGGRVKYPMGGKVRIEAEGGEAMQLPNGQVGKIKGPSHAEGGVKLNVPEGTKIYSDRIMIGGKTMQERKIERQKRLDKINKMLVKNPTDTILKGTLKRVMTSSQIEEDRDMAIQNVANAQYNAGKFAVGGVAGNPYENYFYSRFESPLPGVPRQGSLGVLNSQDAPLRADMPYSTNYINEMPEPAISNLSNVLTASGQTAGAAARIKYPNGYVADSNEGDEEGLNLEAGDYVGLAGTALGAILPIINTKNNAAAGRPNINRYKSFGKDALDTNQAAIDIAAETKAGLDRDISTGAETSYSRNRNSARGINTLRALDSMTEMGTNKARVAGENNYASRLIGALGQRSSLQNQADAYRMKGEHDRDVEDKADIDNYYSNMAANLANVATSVQQVGRNLNIARSNKVDANLIAALSEHGLTFDKNGKLVSIKQ